MDDCMCLRTCPQKSSARSSGERRGGALQGSDGGLLRLCPERPRGCELFGETWGAAAESFLRRFLEADRVAPPCQERPGLSLRELSHPFGCLFE